MATLVTDYTPLIALTHARWVIPAIAELHSQRGSKLVTLANRLAVAQTTARRALDRAISLGYARRNTGYGHPLRPEYLCTPRGTRIAPRCLALLAAIEGLPEPAQETCAFKWSIPILAALHAAPARFGELRAALGITDRALSLTLRELDATGLIERRVRTEHPPSVVYRVPGGGHSIATAASGLARDTGNS